MKRLAGGWLGAMCALAAAHWTPGPVMPLPRAGYMAGMVDGKLVIAGGSYWEAEQKRWSDRTDYYDPARKVWTAGPALPEPRSDAASLVMDGALHTWGGGANGSITADCWALANNRWRKLPEMDLPQPRLYALGVDLGGTPYVFGGIREAGKHETAANTLWRWDRNRKRWQDAASLPGPGRSLNAIAAVDGKLYVLGGYAVRNGAGVNLEDVWQYNPASNRWTEAGRFPFARRAWWGVPASKQRILLFGGYTDAFSDEIWEYDTASQQTRLAGHLPLALADSKFFRSGRLFIAAGGESGLHIRSPRVYQGTM